MTLELLNRYALILKMANAVISETLPKQYTTYFIPENRSRTFNRLCYATECSDMTKRIVNR